MAIIGDAYLKINTNANTYTLKYDANNGSGAPSSQTADGVGSYTFTISSTVPKRTGYTFAGWATSTSATSAAYQAGGTYKVSGTSDTTKTLYAVWTANTYTVTFNPNGGAVTTTSKTVIYDSTYGTLPTPTRDHYNFNGWFTAKSDGTKITSSTKVAITAKQTLYAQWTLSEYVMTYHHYSTSVADKTVVIKVGEKFYPFNNYIVDGEVTNPTMEGRTFMGWIRKDDEMTKGLTGDTMATYM